MHAPKSQRVRSHTFRVWKNGQIVSARFEGMETFHAPRVYDRMDRRRVFAVDTESLSLGGKLSTLLIPLRFSNWGELLETPTGLGMLEKFFDNIIDRYGETGERANQYLSPSKTKQRPKAPRRAKRGTADGRDGRRQKIDPCLAVFFNLPYDFGRLSADRRDILRAANAGADSYRIAISDRIELEVVSMHFGSGSSFEWIVRRYPLDPKKRKIARIIGLDLAAYWKTSLAEAAKSVGVTDKISIDPELYKKPREAFTRKEWADFRRYALGDAETTLELYHATVDLLVQIDARVIRRTGVIPPSAPGASARIVFAKAFDRPEHTDKRTGDFYGAEPGCHPGITQWERYSAVADQMGLDAYYGGRSFNVERGIRRGMMVADLKSAYPFALACMPDPVDVRAVPVISTAERRTGRDAKGKPVSYTALQIYEGREKEEWDNEVPMVIDGSFELDRWRGQFGVLYIDGESLDDLYPPFRIHSARKMDAGRLRYVAGPFQNRAVTIPEIVVGVVSGRLRVDRIRKGVVFRGSAENSFIRAGILDFFRIKEDVRLPKPLRDMAKLLAVSLYGKLIEIQTTDYGLGSAFPMARFAKAQKVRNAMARINAENGPPLELLDGIFWGESKKQQLAARTYYDRCQRRLGDGDDRASLAVIDYVTALRRAGMRRESNLDGTENESPIAISDYIGKRYRCGFYFFPLIAANATGLISAMLGLMARELGASQGDTDSVHFVPREAVLLPDAASLLPETYYEMMKVAGYLAPRRVGGGHYVDGIPGAPQLGCWEIQTPEPSMESVLVRPKVYSHLFPDGSLKQAGHGFARFGATHADLGSAFDQLARVLRNVGAGTMPEARAGQRNLEAFAGAASAPDLVAASESSPEGRRRALHEAFKALVTHGHVTYQGRASPRKLKEAMVSGREIGEFNSRVFEAALTEDPNTYRDPEGRTRWKQAVTAQHVPMKDPVRPVFRKVTRRRSA